VFLIYGSKITAASRGFPATARLSCICGLGKLNSYAYSYAVGVKVLKKLYFSSNSVLKVLSKVSCNQKYCQQFLKEDDVALISPSGIL